MLISLPKTPTTICDECSTGYSTIPAELYRTKSPVLYHLSPSSTTNFLLSGSPYGIDFQILSILSANSAHSRIISPANPRTISTERYWLSYVATNSLSLHLPRNPGFQYVLLSVLKSFFQSFMMLAIEQMTNGVAMEKY